MEHVTYSNPDRVGRCEFTVKTILGLALTVLCFAMLPQARTSIWRNVTWLATGSFALYLYILWMFLLAKRLHDFGRTGWWILGFIVFKIVARNLTREFAVSNEPAEVIEIILYALVVFWSGNRERNEYGFPPEYPKTLLGRLGLAGMKRRRVMIIAIMFLLSLGASVACRLAFHK